MDCSRLTKQDMDLLQRSDLFQGCAPQVAARAAADPQCELWEATPGMRCSARAASGGASAFCSPASL